MRIQERPGEIGGTSQDQHKTRYQTGGKRPFSRRSGVTPEAEPAEKGGRAPKDAGARKNYFPPIRSNHSEICLSAD